MTTAITTQPQQTPAAPVASLSPSVLASLGPNHNRDYDLTSYSYDGSLTQDEIQAALRVIDQQRAPATPAQLFEWLGALGLKTIQRKQDQASMDLTLRVYVTELSKYPAGVVQQVLEAWPERNKWWPAWAELKEDIAWRDKNAMMRDALVRGLLKGKADGKTA